jgi:carbon storage regulator CsrA
MLVLSRKCKEMVVIGGGGGLESLLKVTVLNIGRGTVKLGFDVNTDIPVNRGEVWERIRATLQLQALTEPCSQPVD